MNWFLNAIRALSPNCREAVRLQSDALDRPLPFFQRIGLRIHLWLCAWCRRYGKQIRFLRTAARQCEEEHGKTPNGGLPAEARERIKRAMGAGGK